MFAPDLGLDGGLDQGSGHFDPINQSPFRDTNSGPIKSVTLAELKDTQVNQCEINFKMQIIVRVTGTDWYAEDEVQFTFQYSIQ